jgi:hypothetical protein
MKQCRFHRYLNLNLNHLLLLHLHRRHRLLGMEMYQFLSLLHYLDLLFQRHQQ